ncbi:phenylalanine--tRNA ligase subunit beta [soil metagenome]
MKLSLRWLNDFVDVTEFMREPQTLAKHLTNAGLEVESIEDQAKPFQNVVVGHILEKGKHPGADRLTVCMVTTGDGVVHQIVCGATNHNQGDRVVVALPGAVLPGNFAIKHSKIRGVESSGMLCSEKELGLLAEGSDSPGILILPAEGLLAAAIGKPFAEYRGLDDVIMELKVTPNRADCLSHYGLALEVGCLLGRPVKKPKADFKAGSWPGEVSVEIKALDLGPRYAGRHVRGVKVAPSPEWLRRRLQSVGMNSINNVVDVTNYVMMEMGQPLHAFDVREIKGHAISVDRARAGESFTTLDGTELKLDGTELTIRDSERAVALGGVIGGKNSGVSDTTTEVFIESAYFTPGAVRRTMRKFGLSTDSGYRFARGVNAETTAEVLDRATALMIEVAGGEASSDRVDIYPSPLPRHEITVNLQTVEARLGYKVESADFEMWMNRLGGELRQASPGFYKFTAPANRTDLHIEMDIVEEFARLNGYDKLPESLPDGSFSPATHDVLALTEMRVRRLLSGLGCLEAVNYAFTSDKQQSDFLGEVAKIRDAGLFISNEDVRIVNPLSEEINVMRRLLVPSLYRNAVYNFRAGNETGRLFEVGVSSHKNAAGRSERYLGTSYGEEARLGFCFWGGEADLWGRKEVPDVTMVLKGVIESFLDLYGISDVNVETFAAGAAPAFLHPGKCAKLIVKGQPVGFIGALHPSLLTADKVRVGVSVGELSLERLMVATKIPVFQALSNFPAMERDVAFITEKSVPAGDIVATLQKTSRSLEAGESKLLRDLRIFDVFEGASVGEGKRSVAVRMVFQSADGTLEDETVNVLKGKLVDAVCQKLGAIVRA